MNTLVDPVSFAVVLLLWFVAKSCQNYVQIVRSNLLTRSYPTATKAARCHRVATQNTVCGKYWAKKKRDTPNANSYCK